MLNLRTMTKRFIMSEGAKKLVDWKSLIQSVDEALSSLNPKSLRDSRRIELARHNLKEVKSHLRRANERVANSILRQSRRDYGLHEGKASAND